MTETDRHAALAADAVATDVFAAARWFAGRWNSTAKAVSADEIEWQCTTWGSGSGRAWWEETAMFALVAQVFGLPTSCNWEGRDELIVSVPLGKVPAIVPLVERLGEDPDDWPWRDVEVEDRDAQIALAAEVLGMTTDAVDDDLDLLEALRIE